MKETYLLHTIDINKTFGMLIPLPTAEKVNDDHTTFLGPWELCTKIEFFTDGKLDSSHTVIDMNNPIFAAKVLYNGIERVALYKPLDKNLTELAIINMDKQPNNQ